MEFALVLPIFVTMMLGIFTGGQSYNRKLALTGAAREASRYGATLPIGNFAAPFTAPATTSLEAWLVSVATAATQNAEGELASTVSNRTICVAYVYPNGTAANDQTRRLLRAATDAFSASTCFSDGRPNTERRVQISVTRPGNIQGLFVNFNLTLKGQSLSRFEAATT